MQGCRGARREPLRQVPKGLGAAGTCRAGPFPAPTPGDKAGDITPRASPWPARGLGANAPSGTAAAQDLAPKFCNPRRPPRRNHNLPGWGRHRGHPGRTPNLWGPRRGEGARARAPCCSSRFPRLLREPCRALAAPRRPRRWDGAGLTQGPLLPRQPRHGAFAPAFIYYFFLGGGKEQGTSLSGGPSEGLTGSFGTTGSPLGEGDAGDRGEGWGCLLGWSLGSAGLGPAGRKRPNPKPTWTFLKATFWAGPNVALKGSRPGHLRSLLQPRGGDGPEWEAAFFPGREGNLRGEIWGISVAVAFFFFRALSRSSKQPGCLAPARRAAPQPRARLPGSLTYPKSLTYGFYITWLRRRLLRRKRAYFPLSFHAPLGTGCSALARPGASPYSPLGHGSPPRPRILAGVLQEIGRSAPG